MTRWMDALLLGPGRRRRRRDRRLQDLEREYAAWVGAGPTAGSGAHVRRQRDVTSWVAFAIALAGVVGMAVAVPEVVPAPVRNLVGLGPERLADVPTVSGGGSFAFLAHQPGDESAPVTYDPCREILVRVNPAGSPSGGVDLVKDAMAEVSEATGLVLRYDGTTDERPNWESETVPSFFGRVHARPVLVSWASEAEVPELADDVAGIGGSLAVANDAGRLRYVTGGVTLDRDSFETMAGRPDGEGQMRAIVLHELGHLVGLAHVPDPRELMHADNVGQLDFGGGDRRGLAAVGAGPCG